MNRPLRFFTELLVFVLGILTIVRGQFWVGIAMLLPFIVFIIDEIMLNDLAKRFWDDEERRDRS